MSRPRRRRLAIASAVAGAIVAALAATAWLLRDLPRRQVASGLAERLGAEVALGGFTLEGTRRFVLHDLVVTRMAGQNRLRRLSVGTLVVEGGARDALEGRFDALDASSVEIRLGPPDASIPEPTGPAAEVVAGRFRLSGARVVLEGGGAEGVLSVEADLTGIGGDLAGTARATSDRLRVSGAGVDGEARSFAATAEFASGGPSIAARARAGEAVVTRAARSVTVRRPEAAADLAPSDDGRRLGFDARLSLGGTCEARLRGTLDEPARRVIEADGAVRGVDLSTWLPLLPGLPEGLDAAGRLDATVTATKDAPARWTAHAAIARVESPAGTGPSDRVRAEGVDVAVEGEFDATRPKDGGPLKAAVSVPRASGTVSGVAIPASLAPLTLTFEGRASAAGTPAIAGRAVLANGITGRVDVDLDAAMRDDGVTVGARWRLAATSLRPLLELAPSLGVAVPEDLALDGTLSAEGEGAWPAARGPMLVARARVEKLAAALEAAAKLDGAKLSATLSWPAPGAPIAVKALDLEGELEAPPVPRASIRITGGATVDASIPAIRDAALEASSPALFHASATGAWSAGSGGTFTVKLAQADLPRWQSFLKPVLGDVAPGYSVQGTTTADVSGTIARDGTWSGRGAAAIAKSGFSSEDGARVLEGLDTAWDVAVEGHALDHVTARASAKVQGFQILWDSFFADYSALPSSLEAGATVDMSGDEPVWSTSLSWRYPEGPSLDAHAAGAGRGPVAFETTFAIENLGTMLERYLRAPLGDSVAFFRRISGDGALRVRAKGTAGREAFAVAGRVRLEDTRIEGTKGFIEVGGLDLDLPFDLTWGAADAKGERPISGPPLSGSLGFEKLELGGLALAETSTPLRIEADTIGLDEGLALPVLGGALGFEKLTLIDALRPTRRAETAVLLWGLSLEEASAAFGLPPLEGAADGYFPAVMLRGSSFEVKGGGEISVFGGKVKIGDISGEDVLTRFPKMRLSADFEGIDLRKVTGTFDFGDMTGIVSGYVHDLELFRGVPTRFDARLVTVDTKGVHNKINVKAVNNIAILGTGGSVGILDRGIHKFIDEFTYDRIGIELQLANDVFLMRGLEHRGNKELFLKGRFPFPIDVVNAQPGRTVSFRSMLDRLSSVDFASATTGGKK